MFSCCVRQGKYIWGLGNWPSLAWNTALSNFDLENLRSRSWERSKFKATKCVPLPIDSHPFCSISIGPPIPVINFFQYLTFKIQGQGHKPMMLHNYRFRPFHKPSNGVNPSRDMCSAISGLQWHLSWQVFDAWASPYGTKGQITMALHNYRSR